MVDFVGREEELGGHAASRRPLTSANDSTPGSCHPN